FFHFLDQPIRGDWWRRPIGPIHPLVHHVHKTILIDPEGKRDASQGVIGCDQSNRAEKILQRGIVLYFDSKPLRIILSCPFSDIEWAPTSRSKPICPSI